MLEQVVPSDDRYCTREHKQYCPVPRRHWVRIFELPKGHETVGMFLQYRCISTFLHHLPYPPGAIVIEPDISYRRRKSPRLIPMDPYLTSDGKSVANLTLSRSKFTKYFCDGACFNTSYGCRSCLEPIFPICDGNQPKRSNFTSKNFVKFRWTSRDAYQFLSTMMNIHSSGKSHIYKFGSLRIGNDIRFANNFAFTFSTQLCSYLLSGICQLSFPRCP